jgi:antitoxin ParD1/3/4
MARVSTLNVSLTPHQRQLVDDCVTSGQYGSASEVIRDSLRLLEEQKKRNEAYWADVRAKIAEARASIDRGEALDGPTAMAALRAKLEAQGVLPRRRNRKRAS